MRLFHLPQRGKNTAFFLQFSPLADFMAETFYWLFPWNFKEKASTIFYGTAYKNSHIQAGPIRISVQPKAAGTKGIAGMKQGNHHLEGAVPKCLRPPHLSQEPLDGRKKNV